MQETRITIITNILTKPRPKFARIGKFVRAYTPKTALTYERYIASEYQRLGGKYFDEKPLYVALCFYFQAPKLPKYKQAYLENVPCFNTKDLDNLAKAVLDSLNTIAYKDDRQILKLVIDKQYTREQERIEIFITDLSYDYPDNKTLKEKYKDEK